MEFKQYIAPLRKWWWLIVAATLLAAVSSYLAVQRQPEFYRSRATIMMGQAVNDPNPSGSLLYFVPQLLATYEEIAMREPLQAATMAALGMDWLPEYEVQALTGKPLLEIVVTDSSPERAMVVANELANQLVQVSPSGTRERDNSRQEFIDQQLDGLEEQIQETEADLEAKVQELGTLFSARQIADAQTEINGLAGKLNTLQNSYGLLLTNTEEGSVNSLSIIEAAILPEEPVQASTTTTVVTAAAIGFALAVGAAYLLEFLDDSVRTPDQVRRIVDLPTLSGIARIHYSGKENTIVTLQHPRSPISEAYRVLRTGIQFSSMEKQGGAILVTSASPGEGKSTTVTNLAVVIAQAGFRTLALDADLRRPSLHRFFEVNNNRKGLTDFMLEFNIDNEAETLDAHLRSIIRPTSQKNLYLISSGPIPPNPSELLGSDKLRTTLSVLAKRFDYVIVDSPPALAVTDAVLLSTRVDSVLLVVDAGTTRGHHVQQVTQRMSEVNARLIGVVLNRISKKSDAYYYSYNYENPYATDTLEAAGGNGRRRVKSGQTNGFIGRLTRRIIS